LPPAPSDIVNPVPARSLDRARYQVLERRDVRRAVEAELVLVPLFLLVELVVLGRSNFAFAAVTLSALALLGLLSLGWRLGFRRRPHPTAFAIGAIIYGMGVSGATTGDTIGSLMNGLFPVVVLGAAVFMPWSPRWHGAFLVVSAASLVIGLEVAPLMAHEVATGLIIGVASIAVSGVGMLLVRRRHLEMWTQTLELRRGKAALGRTVRDLEAAQHRVRGLEGILPICASCKRIRDGAAWTSVENYVSERSDALFSHGICPDCMARLYPDEAPATASA
jgi:hypothetical protein